MRLLILALMLLLAGPVHALACHPEEAGGYGRFLTRVAHADAGVVIYTWYCAGEGAYIVARPEWGDLPQPDDLLTFKKTWARLNAMYRKNPPTRAQRKLAEQQLIDYMPTPAQRRKTGGWA